MSAAVTTAPEWPSRLRELIERRPELADVGLASLAREASA